MCKYCSPDNEYLDDDDYVDRMLCHRELKGEVYEGMEMNVSGESLHVYVVIPGGHYEKTVKIKHCPMCGRKLDGV